MYSYGFPLHLVKITQSFLKDRSFEVTVGGSTSSIRAVTAGVPQGAVISPTLFNISNSDIPMDNNTEIAMFADDTALLATSHSTPALINKLQKSSDRLSKFFKRWRIRTSGEKSKATIFTRKRAARHRPRKCLKVANVDVTWNTSLKYLGLILDPKLTYSKHIDSILTKTDKLIKSLYPLINRRSKLSTSNKVLLYKSIFRPTISYAAPVWGKCAKTHIKRVQVLQNKVLKIMLDKPRDFSTSSLHQIAQIEPISEFINKLTLKYLQNCRYNQNSDVNSLIA